MKKSITPLRQQYLLKLRKDLDFKPSAFLGFLKWAAFFFALWTGTIMVLFFTYGA